MFIHSLILLQSLIVFASCSSSDSSSESSSSKIQRVENSSSLEALTIVSKLADGPRLEFPYVVGSIPETYIGQEGEDQVSIVSVLLFGVSNVELIGSVVHNKFNEESSEMKSLLLFVKRVTCSDGKKYVPKETMEFYRSGNVALYPATAQVSDQAALFAARHANAGGGSLSKEVSAACGLGKSHASTLDAIKVIQSRFNFLPMMSQAVRSRRCILRQNDNGNVSEVQIRLKSSYEFGDELTGLSLVFPGILPPVVSWGPRPNWCDALRSNPVKLDLMLSTLTNVERGLYSRVYIRGSFSTQGALSTGDTCELRNLNDERITFRYNHKGNWAVNSLKCRPTGYLVPVPLKGFSHSQRARSDSLALQLNESFADFGATKPVKYTFGEKTFHAGCLALTRFSFDQRALCNL